MSTIQLRSTISVFEGDRLVAQLGALRARQCRRLA
jgi:hypothetical protein